MYGTHVLAAPLRFAARLAKEGQDVMRNTLGGAAVLLAVVATASPARANVLDFTGPICSSSSDGSGAFVSCANSVYINQAYGDASNVNVIYQDLINAGTSLRWWSTDYSELEGVAWGGNGDADGISSNRIEFVPVLGQTVTLNSFNLGAWPHSVRMTHLQIRDLSSNAVLVDYGVQTIGTGDLSVLFSPAISSANGLAIQWKDTAFNVGIDNVSFTVARAIDAVPEPATLVLLATGLLAATWRSRRRRTVR
jgi:hypothetical protein